VTKRFYTVKLVLYKLEKWSPRKVYPTMYAYMYKRDVIEEQDYSVRFALHAVYI